MASFLVTRTTPRPRRVKNSFTAAVSVPRTCSRTSSPVSPNATNKVYRILTYSLLFFLFFFVTINIQCLGLEKLIEKSDSSLPCMQPKSTGTCRAIIPSFFFDTATGECTEFTYTGCGGNANNFKSADDCDVKCNGLSGPVTPPPAADSGNFHSIRR